LRENPVVWERLSHLADRIPALWTYQAELTRYYVEHLRRLRATSCAGYVHFWLADLAPSVGCGVIDVARREKSAYAALRQSSAPLQVSLEHDGLRPLALWVFNDTKQEYPKSILRWVVRGPGGAVLLDGETPCAVGANQSERVEKANWAVDPADVESVELRLIGPQGLILAENTYQRPFDLPARPAGYPWKFDPVLGCKVFDRPGAPSLADLGAKGLVRLVPLRLREHIAEWGLRQQFPAWLLSIINQIGKRIPG
jgi:hypothetical protein